MTQANNGRPQAKGVIFDLDGTLLDTLDDLADSLNAMLRQLNFAEHTREDVKGFIGRGMRNLVRQAAPAGAGIDDALIGKCLEIYKVEYEKRWNAKTRPYPGIMELLETLGEKKVPIAVLSNKLHEFTKICIDAYFPETAFEPVLGMRGTVPKKPHPAGALEIAEAFGLKPEEVLFVGDSSVDMDTAVAAGMIPLGVEWGFREPEELIQHGAVAVVREAAEIANFIA